MTHNNNWQTSYKVLKQGTDDGPEETIASNTVCVKDIKLARFSLMSSFIFKLREEEKKSQYLT